MNGEIAALGDEPSANEHEMIREYIDEQAGEAIVDDSRFPIDSS